MAQKRDFCATGIDWAVIEQTVTKMTINNFTVNEKLCNIYILETAYKCIAILSEEQGKGDRNCA